MVWGEVLNKLKLSHQLFFKNRHEVNIFFNVTEMED